MQSRPLSGDVLKKTFRAGHSQKQHTTSSITGPSSHEHQQQLKLSVIEAVANMNRTYTTSEIDAIVGLLMLSRCAPNPSRFLSSSSPAQTSGLGTRVASGFVAKQGTSTTTRKRPRARQKLNDGERDVVHPTSQVPESSSSPFTTSSSHQSLATSQFNAAQHYHAESDDVSSIPSNISLPGISQILQAGTPSSDELSPILPRIAIKRTECLPNVSKSHHPTSTAHPTHTANSLSSTNISTPETQNKTSTTLHPQSTTSQQAPAPLSNPTTLVPKALASPQHQPQPELHQTQASQSEEQDQAPSLASQPNPRPIKSRQQPSEPPYHQPQRRLLAKQLPKPTAPNPNPASSTTTTSTTATPQPAKTKPPAKKRTKKYGTAYEVSRARQIQATGVPRLPGPCLSCARRQRQLDEVAAFAASNTGAGSAAGVGAAVKGASNATVGAASGGAKDAAFEGAAGENMTEPEPGPTGTKKKKGSIGRFARPQRGDEFLPCMVLSNGIRDGSEGDARKGKQHGPTPCARCKSIKMKCEG
ncbi:hypothetical protein B0T20DRAFT_501599 [Sordaria brevicollis]|uniref:Uncharacterized protein n=1 Tax=Sordaria brevicollis TaxID=83679 RepID=A0AAE0PAP0_SORBR|nr:hypothetical protein B0T20DRAFT_501599 [Sordaria brevicollis]